MRSPAEHPVDHGELKAAVPPAPAHPGQALCAHGLSAAYGSVIALEGLDLEVPYGVSVAVLGPNGSGKSSLFAAAVGLLRPATGGIGIGDRGVAWLPQQLDLEPTFPVTVEDVVRMGRWGRGSWLRPLGAEDRRRVREAMEELGVAELADRRLSALSGGQRQRALLAQVMAQDAGLILLDEPLTGVDRPTARVIGELIARWRDEGRAVMVATHDLDSAVRDYDLVIALNKRLIAFGEPAAVCTEPVLRETFSGHVARIGGGDVVDTSHHHPGAG
jgi:ABC-type Mn2+/Zn2+ transport system ATPase subunit